MASNEKSTSDRDVIKYGVVHRSKDLLSTIYIAKDAATALVEWKQRWAGKKLPKSGAAIDELDSIIEAMTCIHEVGRRQAGRVSPVPYVLEAFEARRKSDMKNQTPRDNDQFTSESMQRINDFVGSRGENLGS